MRRLIINISKFLKTVDEYRDMDKAMDLLTKNLPTRDLIAEEREVLRKAENSASNIESESTALKYLEESPADRIDRITKQHSKEVADNPLSLEDKGMDQDAQIK